LIEIEFVSVGIALGGHHISNNTKLNTTKIKDRYELQRIFQCFCRY